MYSRGDSQRAILFLSLPLHACAPPPSRRVDAAATPLAVDEWKARAAVADRVKTRADALLLATVGVTGFSAPSQQLVDTTGRPPAVARVRVWLIVGGCVGGRARASRQRPR